MVLRPPLSPLSIFKARNEPLGDAKKQFEKKKTIADEFIDELTELPKGNPKVSNFRNMAEI